MSVAGLCGVCEVARADHQCRRCGTLVCDEHFEADRGICVECARDDDPERFQM